jgi:ATP-dependent Lon protease
VIVPKENEKDIEDFPKYLRKDMNFIFATTVDDVLAAALEKQDKGKGAAKIVQKTTKKNAKKKIIVRSKATH